MPVSNVITEPGASSKVRPITILLPFHNPVFGSEIERKDDAINKQLLRQLLLGHFVDYARRVSGDHKIYRGLDIYHNAFDNDYEVTPVAVSLSKDLHHKINSDKVVRENLLNVFRDIYHHHYDKDNGKIVTGILAVKHNTSDDIYHNLLRIIGDKEHKGRIPVFHYLVSDDGKRGLIMAHKGVPGPDERLDDDDPYWRAARKETKNIVSNVMSSLFGSRPSLLSFSVRT